jgi:hypothetical protein
MIFSPWPGSGSPTNTTVGGALAGAGNTIAHSQTFGLRVDGAVSGVRMSGNSIHSNAGLGIDLLSSSGAAGVTLNDLGDGDSGGNGLQNFPLITSAESDAAALTITGTLNSSPSAGFLLEFFANDDCDATGFGEGQAYLGSVSVTTNAAGNASFDATFPGPLPGGQIVTATATNAVNGNTSEFAACAAVSVGVTIVSANPPLDNPFAAGTQPFQDVLQHATTGGVPRGIGAAGTPTLLGVNYANPSVTFSAALSPAPSADNITVACTDIAANGQADCPTVMDVVAGAQPNEFVLTLSSVIPPRECTTITFAGTAPGQRVQYQSLPGNASIGGAGGAIVSPQDITVLISAISTGTANTGNNPLRYNIDRAGTAQAPVTPADVTRLIALVNGGFNGASVAGCP